MPAMDGLQFCLAIKQNFKLCGIPILVLTSGKDNKSQINILQCGADDVIPKPFSATILPTKVRNIIRSRKLMVKNEMSTSEIMSVGLSAIDEEFIKNINKVILENISDPLLSADDIASKMNVSKSTLYFKVKSLTGFSNPSYFSTSFKKYFGCTPSQYLSHG